MLFIVVPTFNRPECILSLIGQLKNQSFNDYCLVIVDHGNEKNDFTESQDHIYINASSDLWWTGAINIGIRYVLDECKKNVPLLIINDDVEFANIDYLKNLYNYWKLHDEHIVGSICTSRDGKIIYANMLHNYWLANLRYYFKGEDVAEIKTETLNSDVLKGRGTLIPSEVFKEIGLYNEKFLPHYRADHELIYRAYKKGYKVKVLKNAVLYSVLDSPNSIDKLNRFKSLWNVLWGKRSVANLKDLFNYSFLCFNPIYAVYYFLINASKIVLMYSIKAIK